MEEDRDSGITRPLEGVRIVDLTVVWAGPGGTALLGDLGAEVIRVEDIYRNSRNVPSAVDPTRLASSGYHANTFAESDPGTRPYERSSSFNWHARNKLSVTMTLTAPEGVSAFLKLVSLSDVVIENSSPGVLEKLGLTYERLRKANDQIILVRMPPLGLSGLMSSYIGYGPNFNSVVGIASMDGYEGESPLTAGENYHMDETSPPSVAFAVLAALWEREQAGEGQMLEFPQAENLMIEIGEFFLDHQFNNRSPSIRGNSHPHVFQGVFETAESDRWIAITVRDDDEWSRLCGLVGSTVLSQVGDTVPSRLEHRNELSKVIADWVKQLQASDVVRWLQDLRIPAGEVMSELRVLADSHLASRNWFQTRTHQAVGTFRYPGHAWSGDSFELAWGRPLPGFGEDNEYVYKEVLGYSNEEFDSLQVAGLVGDTQVG
jgi:crotonobetainyl-CoA:carnitine CoA-transferase CaiB-like acyl-CoA transferase